MEIIDNFLEQEKFDKLQTLMMGPDFSWFFNTVIESSKDSSKDDEDKFQFVHIFYIDNIPRSSFCEQLTPILNKIEPASLWRIKANLLTRTPNIVENAFHVDMKPMPEEKLKQWTTSIFYVNTNNGYTKFEDGSKVESVANRLVTCT